MPPKRRSERAGRPASEVHVVVETTVTDRAPVQKPNESSGATTRVPSESASDKPAAAALKTGGSPNKSSRPSDIRIRVICNSNDELVQDELAAGNVLLKDLVWLHGRHIQQGTDPSSEPSDDIIKKAASRIVALVANGPEYSIAGSDCIFGTGRFFREGRKLDLLEIDDEEAQKLVAGLLCDALEQTDDAKHESKGKRKKDDQELYADENADAYAVVQQVDESDVLLSKSSQVGSHDDKANAEHKGTKAFRSLLDSEASNKKGDEAAPWSIVDSIKTDKKGRFLAPKEMSNATSNAREWVDLGSIAASEAATVLLWTKQSTPGVIHGVAVDLRTEEADDAMKWPSQQSLAPPSKVPIKEPTEHDVLFGRGGLTNHHKGNKRFRDVIALRRPDYIAAVKIEKPNVARWIVRAIRSGNPPGRFLKKSTNDGRWYDVGDRTAAEKASQALREKPQEVRQQKALKRKEERSKTEQKEGSQQQMFPATPSPAGAPFAANGGAGPSPSPYGTMPPPGIGPSPPGMPPVMGLTPTGYIIAGPGAMMGQSPPPLPSIQAAAASGASVNKRRKTGSGTDDAAAGAAEDNKDGKAKTAPVAPDARTSAALAATGPIDAEGNVIVTDNDILCGRGGLTNHHRGNKRFRDIVGLHRQDYVRAPKVDKPGVARLIVAAIRGANPPGRFLKKDPATGKWFDIGDKRATEKASQALREKTPEERVRIAAKGEGPSPARQYLAPTAEAAPPAAAASADAAPAPAPVAVASPGPVVDGASAPQAQPENGQDLKRKYSAAASPGEKVVAI